MTQRQKPSPREMLGNVISIFAVPLCMIALAFIAHDPRIFIVEIIAILIVHLGIRRNIRIKRGNNHETRQQTLRNALAFATFSYFLLDSVNTASSEQNPFGTLGWSIVLTSGALVPLAFFVKKLCDQGRVDPFWVVTETPKLWLLIALFAQTYIYWATSWVWIPLTITSLFMFTVHNELFEVVGDDNDESFGWQIFPIGAGIGLISTVCQYWFTPIILGYPLWSMLLVLLGIAICVFGFYWVKNKITKYKKEQSEKRAAAEEENLRQKELAERNAKIAKVKQEEYNTWSFLKQKVESGSPFSLEDFYKYDELARSFETTLTNERKYQLVANIDPKTVLREVSRIKQEVKWYQYHVNYLFDILEDMAMGLNDTHLTTAKTKMREIRIELHECKNYKGVDGIWIAYKKRESLYSLTRKQVV